MKRGILSYALVIPTLGLLALLCYSQRINLGALWHLDEFSTLLALFGGKEDAAEIQQ